MSVEEYRARAAWTFHEGAALCHTLAEECAASTAEAAELLVRCFRSGGKVLLFGNGGSAADAQHVAAEFVGRFARDRASLPAIALTCDTSALTAIANDYGYEAVFARQVRGLGRPGDVAIAISTSGRSPSVVAAARVAKENGLSVIALTGGDGGTLAALADIAIVAPTSVTARVQECHLAIEHLLCEFVEDALFPVGDGAMEQRSGGE